MEYYGPSAYDYLQSSIGCQRLREIHCFYLQGRIVAVEIKAVLVSEMLTANIKPVICTLKCIVSL